MKSSFTEAGQMTEQHQTGPTSPVLGRILLYVHDVEALAECYALHFGFRIRSENGIAEAAGEGARWALDHLLDDQDARPTLAKVKRGWSPEMRRTIIGPLLEYASHASETWTAHEPRGTLLRNAEARGRDPQEELAALLQTDVEPDAGAFWGAVATNLAAKHLRLLFVSDRSAHALARVVTFLNEQMPNVVVLAVEIKRFQGKTNQTLVPRVIGRTGRGKKAGRERGGTRLTRDTQRERLRDVASGVGERQRDGLHRGPRLAARRGEEARAPRP